MARTRGAVGKKRQLPEGTGPAAAVRGTPLDLALMRGLIKDSQLKSKHAKAALARAAAMLVAQLKDLEQRLRLGIISAEEQRAIPAVASNLRRICESLGVTVPAEDEDELKI